MELLNDARVIMSVLLALPVGAMLTWLRFRERQWMLSWRRARSARKLFQKAEWRKAAPLDFHFAMTDAFGRSVEPIELAFIEARQSPVRLLLDRIEAGAWVKYSEEANRYVDSRGPRAQLWLPFARVSRITTLAASFSISVFSLLVLLSWQSAGGIPAAMMAALGVFWFWLMLTFSLMADAANRILTSERYLPALALPRRSKRKAAERGKEQLPTSNPERTVDVACS